MGLPISIIIFLVVGCSSPQVVSGTYFNDRRVDSIVVSKTTMDDVRYWFGEPILSEESKPGLWIFTYEYRIGPTHPTSSFPAMSGDPKLAGKSLIVGFKNEVVSFHSFSENEAGYVGTLVRADQ
ncbi:MAG: hypothetical protein H8E15_12780 [Planctomycetes bacterium]|nr:hypothetical protein [Planctomycetota bacterium]